MNHSAQPNGTSLTFCPAPAVSCFRLTVKDFSRREDAALARAQQIADRTGHPADSYGREILWHPRFAAEFLTVLKTAPLHLITQTVAVLTTADPDEGQPLDATDCGYLADLLRDELADLPPSAARLRLERALAWLEVTAPAI